MSGIPVLSGEHGKIKGMARQRGELVPIGDALSGVGGPVKAIRPQNHIHFRADGDDLHPPTIGADRIPKLSMRRSP